MYNRLNRYLTANNLIYCKQFWFQKELSPEHAILQLVEQINQSFEKNEFTLGMFADLSKVFNQGCNWGGALGVIALSSKKKVAFLDEYGNKIILFVLLFSFFLNFFITIEKS